MQAIVFIILQVFCTTSAVLKIGEYHSDIVKLLLGYSSVTHCLYFWLALVSSKYGTTRKNIQRYYTPKHQIRYNNSSSYSALQSVTSTFGGSLNSGINRKIIIIKKKTLGKALLTGEEDFRLFNLGFELSGVNSYPGPRGFLLFFIGKFCDANRFLHFFIGMKRWEH